MERSATHRNSWNPQARPTTAAIEYSAGFMTGASDELARWVTLRFTHPTFSTADLGFTKPGCVLWGANHGRLAVHMEYS